MPAKLIARMLVVGAAALAACDIPTALPRWETRWRVPLDSTRIGVASLLPAGVRIAPGGATFEIDLPSTTLHRTLRQMCGNPCVAASGQVVPKPSFTTTFGTTIALPQDVAAARLTQGQFRVELTHNLAFDPIRPSSTARGYILMVASSGATVLARDSIPGQTVAFPSGTTLNRVVAITPQTVTGPISVNVTVFSPAGDPVRVNPDQSITIVVEPQQARVAEVEVRVPGRTISTPAVALDLQDFDATVIDEVTEGALIVEMENPFAVSGPLELVISWPGGEVRRTLQLAPDTTTQRVELTGPEIRSFLGQPSVVATVSGTVTSGTGTVRVTPAAAVVIRPALELAIGAEEG